MLTEDLPCAKTSHIILHSQDLAHTTVSCLQETAQHPTPATSQSNHTQDTTKHTPYRTIVDPVQTSLAGCFYVDFLFSYVRHGINIYSKVYKIPPLLLPSLS